MTEDVIERKYKQRIKCNYCTKYYAPYAFHRIKDKYPNIKINDIHRALNLYFKYATEDLALGHKVVLLNKLGSLYLTKELRGVEYNEETGKIINTFPVNIHETVKLWKQKPELKNKTFVRFTNDHSDNYTFRLHYQNSKAIYKNKNIYNFQFSKPLKKKLGQNIFNKKVDAYLINRKKGNNE